MTARTTMASLFLLTACTGAPDDSGDTSDTAPQPGEFAFYVNVTVPAQGDRACYDGGDWLTQEVDTALQVTESVSEVIEDFEFENAVPDASLDVWLADEVDGAPDVSVDANDSGVVTTDLPVCTPLAYRTRVPPALDSHKDTYEFHQVFEPAASSPEAAPYNAVARSTYLVILSLLGVTADPTLGVVAGTLYDCNQEPIEGAQVVVVDDEGEIAPGSLTKYFIDSFPARDQPYTSDDGLWTAINLPPGNWNVEAWVSDGDGGHTRIGSTRLEIFADSINISNIYTGFSDGIRYPDSCLVTPTR